MSGEALGRGPIGRRSFVKTSGGILIAAGVGAACSDGGIQGEATGTVKVTITGLGTGLVDGGSALVTRTDGTFTPLTIPLPAPVGAQQAIAATAEVPVGTYHVVYTPPAGYSVTGGNAFDVTVEDGIITSVDVLVSPIAAAQGTLKVVITGMTGSGSAGSASLLRTDIAGQTAVVVPLTLPAANQSVVVASGTYQVTYTTPTGFQLSAGQTNPQNVNVTTGATTTVTFVVQAVATGFQPGDLANNLSFEGTYDGLVNGSGGTPTGFSLDTTKAKDGVTSIKRVLAQSGWLITSYTAASPTVVFAPGSNFNDGQQIGIFATPDNALNSDFYNAVRFAKRVDADHFAVYSNAGLTTPVSSVGGTGGQVSKGDVGPHLARAFGNGSGAGCVDRLFGRFYFYFDGVPSSPLKFQIYEDSTSYSAQWGGLYLINGAISWLFNAESAGSVTKFVNLSGLLNAWHSLEVDFWLNGDTSGGGAAGTGYPSVALWLDDVNLTSTIAAQPANTNGSFPSFITANGVTRLNAGFRGPRPGTGKLGTYNMIGVLNRGNLNPCNVWVDRVSVSTLGRVGP
jgi:hypothetical protein